MHRWSFAQVTNLYKFGLLLFPSVLALSAAAINYEPSSISPPKVIREFRGCWVATVGNIDWPSQKGLTTAEQKAELVAILDRASALNLNLVVFQVRPSCDAMYASRIEPWSEYLTGAMGQPPEPFYDPLMFAVAEAHKRGLELHAWFNPYRARQNSAKSPISANHISRTRPELVRQYGKLLWLDPGEKPVQEYSLSVVMDVVNRYDIDGVHFDDYFYPYKEKDRSGEEVDFPDDRSWSRYGAGGKLARDDWRRENVNLFIQSVYRSIKAAKPWVKFGVSPFGIWRPGFPREVEGFDAYAQLYADSRQWLNRGWVDYFAPQLYWSMDSRQQNFSALLRWWAGQNSQGRHLLAGLDTTKTRGTWEPEEILRQIHQVRKQPGADGHIHWNMKSLMRNSTLDADLQKDVYAQPALVPPSPWLGSALVPKAKIAASFSGGKVHASWSTDKPETVKLWLVQAKEGSAWNSRVLPGGTMAADFKSAPEMVAISAIDRYGNSSAATVLKRTR